MVALKYAYLRYGRGGKRLRRRCLRIIPLGDLRVTLKYEDLAKIVIKFTKNKV